MLTVWWKWTSREHNRNVLIAFRGDRFGYKWDTEDGPEDEPRIRCKKRIAKFLHKAKFDPHWQRPIPLSVIGMEILRQCIVAEYYAKEYAIWPS